MKKRYSEYVGYKYKGTEEWFNPQVEWDTPLFIDPMLLKNIRIPEFKNSYNKVVDFFSQAIVKVKSSIPQTLKESIVCFEEVSEANLGYTYDGNTGSGLTGKTALSVLDKIDHFVNKGLFGLEDFADIALFDENVNKDRITDMIINIIKNDFIEYSNRIADENGFPTKEFNIKQEFDFVEIRWIRGMIKMPYVVNDAGIEVPVLLIPKGLLVTDIYCNVDNFMTWLYRNSLDYVKDTFDYNLKKDITKNKNKIMLDIIENKRADILKRFNVDAKDINAYDVVEDKSFVYSIYELAKQFYSNAKKDFRQIEGDRSTMPVKDVVEILIGDLQNAITDKKGYTVIKNERKELVAEIKISKFVHLLFDQRIKDAGFNVDISPETNPAHGPVDFKISRGQDKVLIENKLASNPKLLTCIDEDKQIHTYLKAEECKNAYLLVFTEKEKDVEKIRELTRKSEEYRSLYNIQVRDINCIEQKAASKR